ncbi:hypothetical protein [Myxococcus sp. CA040A]|uniref:hypothetical protein n=1 Tax=Myxococcus sp. CA040A TaxID=2741738 RepID=UPI001C2D7686|nr:hypothetical protein [Myxococcus sp. CA040A]NTX05821.1 hypothetical protein [Myxococcus sp. CA040A]
MPSNSANPALGTFQAPAPPPLQMELNVDCGEKLKDSRPDKMWDSCMVEQLCAMVKAYNESPHPKKKVSPSSSHPSSKFPEMSADQARLQDAAFNDYCDGLKGFTESFAKLVEERGKDHPDVADKFHAKCQHGKWVGAGGPVPVPRSKSKLAMNPDHAHPVGLGGPTSGPALSSGLKWADARVNCTVGPAMDKHDPAIHSGGIKAHVSCNCSQ